MSNRKRKHGIFAVNSEVVLLSSNKAVEREGKHISVALETVFKQMRIAGNRPRTIESYEYIFKQFVEVCGIVVVEEINLDKLYHYLDVLQVTPANVLLHPPLPNYSSFLIEQCQKNDWHESDSLSKTCQPISY